MTSIRTLFIACAVCVGVAEGLGRSAEAEGEALEARMSEDTPATSSRGAFLPFSQAASVGSQPAYVTSFGGYDGARKAATFEATTEVTLWGPLALRGGVVYTNGAHALRPSVGARLQGLREGRHGVDGAIGVFYRPEGLTEPEGEIEGVVSMGRHVGTTYLLGCLVYGQDPEGSERDGEIRAAALRRLGGRVLVGVDSRLRFDLGSNRTKLLAHNEPIMDGMAGPIATVFVGPLALSLQGGGSVFRPSGQERSRYGAFVMSGVGVAF